MSPALLVKPPGTLRWEAGATRPGRVRLGDSRAAPASPPGTAGRGRLSVGVAVHGLWPRRGNAPAALRLLLIATAVAVAGWVARWLVRASTRGPPCAHAHSGEWQSPGCVVATNEELAALASDALVTASPPLTRDGDWFEALDAKNITDSAGGCSGKTATKAEHVDAPPLGGVYGLRRLVEESGLVTTDVRAQVDAHAARNRRWANHGTASASLLTGPGADADLSPEDVTPSFILDTFYPFLRDRFPHVLTYRPRVDCERGWYVHADIIHDGFGMSTVKHMLKVLVQLEAGLTGVHVPFSSNHPPETAEEQDAFWGEGDWDVTLAELEACPSTSAVRRNVLVMSQGSPTMTDVVSFVDDLRERGEGGTVRILTDTGLAPIAWQLSEDDHHRFYLVRQWLFQVRWHCRNLPYAAAAITPAILEQARADVPFRMHLGVHIRRGDIIDSETGGARSMYEERYRPLDFYYNVTSFLLAQLRTVVDTGQLQWQWLRPIVTVYTEGTQEELAPLTTNLTRLGYCTLLNLDSKTSRVFASLAESDATILTVDSSFSCYIYMHLQRLRVGPDRIYLAPSRGVSVSDYDSISALTVSRSIGRVWAYLLEWKLRRAEHLARCSRFSRACLLSNPYLLPPLGPFVPGLLPSESFSIRPMLAEQVAHWLGSATGLRPSPASWAGYAIPPCARPHPWPVAR